MSAHESGARYKIGDIVEFKKNKKHLYGLNIYKVDHIDRDTKGKRWYTLTGTGGMYHASDLRIVNRKGKNRKTR
jgi:hypothetical protein